jgi:hypothetical protein
MEFCAPGPVYENENSDMDTGISVETQKVKPLKMQVDTTTTLHTKETKETKETLDTKETLETEPVEKDKTNNLVQDLEISTLTPHQIYELVTEIKKFFGIENSNVIVKIYRIIEVLDKYKYMQENIELYYVAVSFLVYLRIRFPNLFSNESFVPVFLIMALMITHKYFVETPYDNKTISILYNIPIAKINRYEMEILKMLDYQLPFVRRACRT